MKPLTIVLVAFLLLATSAVDAQPVTSAPYTGTPAGTSSGEILWSQLDDPTGSAFTDQAFEAVYAAYDSSGADDFIMQSAGWRGCMNTKFGPLFTPGTMSVPGSSPLFVNVAFYEDAGGQPGAVIAGCDFPANTNFSSTADGDLTIDVDGCMPRDGLMWFSQQVRMDFNPGGQHFWATRNNALMSPGVWKNPGNGFGNGCLDWQPANAVCGMTGEDWLFELSYEWVCWDNGEDGVPAIGPFGVVMMILALGGGSAYVLRRRR